MPIINLKNLDPDYQDDVILSLPDVLVEVYAVSRRHEQAYQRRRAYHRAYYSLDAGDGIEKEATQSVSSPEELLLKKATHEQLQEALEHLPPIQARRVYARCVLRERCIVIAQREGVSRSAITDTVHAGLKNLKRYCEQHFDWEGGK